jgi:hypothetical protein
MRNLNNSHFLKIIFLMSIMIGCAGIPEGEKAIEEEHMALINSLHTQRVVTLYYDVSKYPENVNELIAKSGNVEALISSYRSDDSDYLFRFNIIMILNEKTELASFSKKKAEIAKGLSFALSDPSPWVRTEAVWGIGRLGYDTYVPDIIPFIDDLDDNVVNETILALEKLTGFKSTKSSNQKLSPTVRALAVSFWKNWWEENKGRYEK